MKAVDRAGFQLRSHDKKDKTKKSETRGTHSEKNYESDTLHRHRYNLADHLLQITS